MAVGVNLLPQVQKTANHAIVMALTIDDGLRGRGHRRNILNPNYNAAGVAFNPHAGYGIVYSIDFASGCAEGTFVCAGTDAANSF